MLQTNGPTRAQNRSMLENAQELSHIARKRVVHEQRQNPGFHRVHVFPQTSREPGQELIHEQRNITPALAKRREPNRDHVESVVEVLSEPSCLHLAGQVVVSRSHIPDVCPGA